MRHIGYALVRDQTELKEAAKDIRDSGPLALDIECDNGLHHYIKKVCLIQLATRDSVYIVDPLSGIDLSPIGSIVEDENVEKIIHDSGFDIRVMERDFGWKTKNIFDTLIAARICGHKSFGLSAMLEKFFNLKCSKKFQRADWTVRPLKSDMLDYAAGDVSHLVALRDLLKKDLEKLGRMKWAAARFKACESIRYEEDSRPLFAKVKSAKDLCDSRELAILNELAEAREKMARDIDLPPFKLCSDKFLIELAKSPPRNESDLASRKGLHPFMKSRGAVELIEAIGRGLASKPLQWPSPARGGKRRNVDPALFESLRKWREEISVKNEVDPDIIISMDTMRSIAAGKPVVDVLRDDPVLGWVDADVLGSLKKLVCGAKK